MPGSVRAAGEVVQRALRSREVARLWAGWVATCRAEIPCSLGRAPARPASLRHGNEPELQAGSTFGPYRLVAPLGHGGTASVYTAYDPQLDRRVALKVLPAELLRDGNRRVERDAHDRHVHCRRSPAAQAAVRCRV